MATDMEIVAAGMVSSVGYGLKMSCAAARAGISRPGQVACRVTGSDGGPELATGHRVAGLTDGFCGDARLMRLLGQALRDFFAHAGSADLPEPLGYYLGIPNPARRRAGLDRIIDDDERQSYEREVAPVSSPVDDGVRARRILNEAMNLSGVQRAAPQLRGVSSGGHVAFASLVESAQNDLNTGEIQAAIVACVDSLVTEPELRWLHVTRRLKSGTQPVGLAPGEAAGVIAFVPSRTRARSLAGVQGVRRTRTDRELLGPDPQNGSGLVELLRPLLDTFDQGRPLAWLVTDQNGEPQRAAEWGNAIIRLRAQSPTFDAPDLWYPVTSFGDVGVASGVVNTCMVLHAFDRGFAPSEVAAVVNSADGADKSAVLIGRGRARG